jgi:uncharacterized protein
MTSAHAATTDGYFAPLRDEQFVVLSTFRASGEAVPTTVWFAGAGGTIYITTNALLKKVGRIRANPRVLLAPSDRVGAIHGPAIEARACLSRMSSPAPPQQCAQSMVNNIPQ